MKSINTNTILQIVALLFLVIIGYMSFSSGSNWKSMKREIDIVRNELNASKDTLALTKVNLKKSQEELKKMHLEKDIFKRERDSILLEFERKNAEDWNSLQAIKDSININNRKLNAERELLKDFFGIE